MILAPSKPAGSITADTVSEYHFGSRAQSSSRQPCWTAARTPLARNAWRANTCSRPSSNSIASDSLRPWSNGIDGVYGK